MPPIHLTTEQQAAFYAKVSKIPTARGCLEWLASCYAAGYGHVSGGRYAHRVAWVLVNGQIPDGLFVCHHCDNPRCCNVEHLFLGTAADNARDRAAKGRNGRAKGATGGSTLTADQVLEIRSDKWADKSTKERAMTFRHNALVNGDESTPTATPSFIDVFAGAGGLSLGLMQAGWNGLFAVEKSPMAFETLKFNLIDSAVQPKYSWPAWLPSEPIDIDRLCEDYRYQLECLKHIPLLAGGPPCQGFSRAGRREQNDERNFLVDKYLALVDIIQPQMLLIENVTGFAEDFLEDQTAENDAAPVLATDEMTAFNADVELQHKLQQRGYQPFVRPALTAKTFGVPQLRPRYILIAIKRDLMDLYGDLDPFDFLNKNRNSFLKALKLPVTKETSLQDAIGDLLRSHGEVSCIEPSMGGFRQGRYGPIKSSYQQLIRTSKNGIRLRAGQVADSHRFPNHKQNTIDRFQEILDKYPRGVQLREKDLKELGTNKHRLAPLSAMKVCYTLTSLPDDLIHYQEPRVLTVREYARIQSFPDWFQFKSNYTSGGERRRSEVPRYTQVANAVPPLLARAIGSTLLQIFNIITGPQQTPVSSEKCADV